MKIIRLKSENIKRLHVIEVTPDGALITVGGKNGAGKSSVLDSIAYALGGTLLVPAQPIRTGEAEAKVTVDLGELIVTRRFYRDVLPELVCEAHPETAWPHAGCGGAGMPNPLPRFGETKSTLMVTNKDGAKYPSPQAVLDKLLGELTFDPLQFARATSKEQDSTLRKLVGLDVSKIDEERKIAARDRTLTKRTHDIKTSQLLTLPTHKNVPDAEIPMSEISADMLKAEELRVKAVEAERHHEVTQALIKNREQEAQRHYDKIDLLRKQIEVEQTALDAAVNSFQEATAAGELTAVAVKDALDVVPDVALIRQRLTETESINNKVRDNRRHIEAQAEIDKVVLEIKRLDAVVKAADQAKEDALKAVKFPVDGLGLSDDGVTFGGIPFEQASSSEQLRVSVMVGLGLNPNLKVLLVRNGNMLDNDSLQALAALAESAGAQVWIEWVTDNAEGVAVMLEDGSLQAAATV